MSKFQIKLTSCCSVAAEWESNFGPSCQRLRPWEWPA